MGSHSVTCHLAAVTFPPLPQPKLVLDLATLEGCKAELTRVMFTSQDSLPATDNYLSQKLQKVAVFTFQLYWPTEGWPGWVDLAGWLHVHKMVYPRHTRLLKRVCINSALEVFDDNHSIYIYLLAYCLVSLSWWSQSHSWLSALSV